MNTRMRRMGLFVILVASMSWMNCGGGSSVDSNAGGSWYVTGLQWPHDGKPLESDNFVIYSDGAGEDAKQALAVLAEETLSDIKTLFAIDTHEIFLYPPGQTKMHIYAYKNHFSQEWGGRAYYGGLMIFSPDHPEHAAIGNTVPEIYNPTMKHELTHVVEFLVRGSSAPDSMDIWWTEGIAEAVSGGTAGGSIRDLHTWNELRNQYGSLNPIAMHRWENPGIEVGFYYYYPMFQLAAEYLVDANGHGGTMLDVKNLWLDVRNGVPFPAAFQYRFGMSLSEYEDRFFDWMTEYLP